MKRDMDLVRELLLKLESLPLEPGHALVLMPESSEVATGEHSGAEIEYHLSLILEAGFVEHVDLHPMRGITFTRLSWRGHEFSTRSEALRSGTKRRTALPRSAARASSSLGK